MAKKDEKLNYGALTRELRAGGPKRLYLLYGPEAYLREQFLAEVRRACVPEGENDFSCRKLDGAALEMRALSDAVNALPFLTERTFTEVRGFDLNRCRDADAETLEGILSDLPDYATLVFVQDSEYEPDWRLKAARAVKKYGETVCFTAQEQSQLLSWVRRRFAHAGKAVAPDATAHLIFVSGDLMSGLIPEIEKIAAAVPGDTVTAADVDAYAHHLPEARVFEMTDRMAQRDWDGAARLMAELLASGEEPIAVLAVMGQQMRRLYAARLALDQKLGKDYVNRVAGIRYDFITEKLLRAARGFSPARLTAALELCAETDYAMKSSGQDDAELLRTLLVRLAAEAAS